MGIGRIVLTGASGLVGTSLVRSLLDKRIQISQLVRHPASSGGNRQLEWDPYSVPSVTDPSALNGIVAAVHLSGASVAGHRWTLNYKNQIRSSRVQSTQALAKLLADLRPRPRVLVSASAVGIYGTRGDELLTERSELGNDFLAEVCKAWEEAAKPAVDAGIRVVHLRFGVVLSAQGGALKQMLPLFRLGLAGRLGSGRQWMSWVALADVIRAIEFALETDSLHGPANVVSPQPVTNADFTRTLGRVLHRPTLVPAPRFALRAAFGEMADTILASQRVLPERLQAAGFRFQYAGLEDALRAALAIAPS